MDQTTWVINVLDDSRNKSIEYKNRFWLRQNVDKYRVIVCVEDCIADIFRIAEYWKMDESILIQDGEVVQFRGEFNPTMEALLLVKSLEEYYVFLYSPEG